MRLLRSTLPLVLALAGCAVTVAPAALPDAAKASRKAAGKADPSTAPRTEGPKAASSAASPRPSAAGALAASVPPLVAAAASAKPAIAAPKFPTKILPALPASLVAAGAGNLIGPDGGSLIGNDGGSLIGADGGSLIGNDGGSYRLAQAALPAPIPTCGPLKAPRETGGLFRAEFKEFLANCEALEDFFATAQELALVPGVPETVEERSPSGKVISTTYLLEAREQGGVLKIANGKTVTPENYLVVLTFTSPEAGDAIYRVGHPEKGFKMGAHITFDHAKGVVASDTTLDVELMGMQLVQYRRQVEVTSLTSDGPLSPYLRVASGTYIEPDPDGCAVSRLSLAIHYLPDERAVMHLAVANTPTDALRFVGFDRIGEVDPGPDSGLFLDKDGSLLDGEALTAELRPALPARELMKAPPPPLEGDVFAQPVYTATW